MINHMYRRGAQVYHAAQRRRARLRPRQPGRAGADAEPGAAALLRAGARRVSSSRRTTVRLARIGRAAPRTRRSCSRTATCSRSTRPARGAPSRCTPAACSSTARASATSATSSCATAAICRRTAWCSPCWRSTSRPASSIAGPDFVVARRVRRGRAGTRTSRRRARWCSATLAQITPESRTDSLEVKEEVRKALRRYLSKTLDRRPVVVPFVMEM